MFYTNIIVCAIFFCSSVELFCFSYIFCYWYATAFFSLQALLAGDIFSFVAAVDTPLWKLQGICKLFSQAGSAYLLLAEVYLSQNSLGRALRYGKYSIFCSSKSYDSECLYIVKFILCCVVMLFLVYVHMCSTYMYLVSYDRCQL